MKSAYWNIGGFVVFAALIAFLLVAQGYFPYVGFGVLVVVLVGILWHERQKLSNWGKWYGVISGLLGVFLLIRSDEMILLLNFMAAFWFGALMVLDLKRIGFTEMAGAPIIVLQRIFISQNKVWKELHTRWPDTKKLWDWGLSIGLTLVLLLVVVPLLASANVLFRDLVEAWLNPEWFSSEIVFINLMRLVIFGVLLWFLPKLAASSPAEKVGEQEAFPVMLQLPKLVLAIVILVFLATQVQLYLLDAAGLARMGLTHSQRTREVFGQLGVVSVIVLGILMLKQRRPTSRLVDLGLLTESVFLTGFALLSDWQYISQFGLTQKRLWGIAMVVWLIGMYGVVVSGMKWKRVLSVRLPLMVTISGILLLLVNAAHFEVLIFHYNQARTPIGPDYGYLSRLASDSYSWETQIRALSERCMPAGCYVDDWRGLELLLMRTKYLKGTFSEFDIRRFNVAHYLTYLSVKDIDVDGLLTQLRQTSPKPQ